MRSRRFNLLISNSWDTVGFLWRNLALTPRHTKEVAYKNWVALSSSMQHLFDIPITKLRLHRWRRCREQLSGGPAGDREIKVVSAICWTNLNGPPLRTFFYKIHFGTVSLDKDKYLTPAPNNRRTRESNESQYTRYLAYSEAPKNSFFPRTIPVWYSLIQYP